MDDFNRDNANIDAAIQAETAARTAAIQAEAAARTAADTALSGRCKIVSGTYTGTGGSSVSIVCGFRPKLLLVAIYNSQYGYSISGPYSGNFGSGFQLYVEGANYLYTYVGGSTNGKTTYTPNATGISWSNSCSDSSYMGDLAMNSNGKTYCWVALG